MNPPWIRNRTPRWFREGVGLLLIGMFLNVTGCYEPANRGQAQTAKGGASTGSDETKTFGYVLIDIFRPSKEAMLDADCGHVSSSLADLFVSENDVRTKEIIAQLTAKSVALRVITTELTPADCREFAPIEKRAGTSATEPDLTELVKSKPALHLRAVLWNGDNSPHFPSSAMTQPIWADGTHWKSLGISRSLGLTYFSINDYRKNGFVYFWRLYSSYGTFYEDSSLQGLDLSDSGMTARLQTVRKSLNGFVDWLVRKAGEI